MNATMNPVIVVAALGATFALVPALTLWVNNRWWQRRLFLVSTSADPAAAEQYQRALRSYHRQDRFRAVLRTSPAFTPVTPVDRSRDGFWRQSWIALCRTSPAFSPVATPPRPTPPSSSGLGVDPAVLLALMDAEVGEIKVTRTRGEDRSPRIVRITDDEDLQGPKRQGWGWGDPGLPSSRSEGPRRAGQDDPEG